MNIGYIVSKNKKKLQEKVAIIDADEGDKAITYQELDHLTDNMSKHLMDLGIGHGDIVMVMLNNSLELQICYFACFKIGAIMQPLNYFIGTEEIFYASDQCKPKVFITNLQLWMKKVSKLKNKMDWILEWYCVGYNQTQGIKPFDLLLEEVEGSFIFPVVKDTDFGQLFFVFSHSQTKFNRRGVLLTHHVMEWHSYPYELMGMNENDVVGCILHPYNALTRAAFKAGATYVIMTEFSGEKFIYDCIYYGITFFGGTPGQFHEILEAAKRINLYPKTLKGCFCVGNLLDNECWSEFETVFGTKIFGGMGCKELGIFTLQPAQEKSVYGSIGKLIPYMEYRLDKSGESETRGYLSIKSHSQISHYCIDRKIHKIKTDDGWFETGFEVSMDEKRYCYLTGNVQDKSISGLKRYFNIK